MIQPTAYSQAIINLAANIAHAGAVVTHYEHLPLFLSIEKPTTLLTKNRPLEQFEC